MKKKKKVILLTDEGEKEFCTDENDKSKFKLNH